MINARTPLAALAAAFVLLTPTALLHAQVPQILSYQGRIAVGDPPVNFDGSGEFKFALVNADGLVTYWSNDDSSTAGSEPTAAVTLTVTKGLYSVLLGDAPMTAIPASVFANADVNLRVWFDDGANSSQLLTPYQRITSSAYALKVHGLTVSQQNTAVGENTLTNSTGTNNTASGAFALRSNTTGNGNSANGASSLQNNTTGFSNTASGAFALQSSTEGSSNTASGNGALSSNTTGGSNTATGQSALQLNTTGNNNIAVGNEAGINLTTGDHNIAIGHAGVADEAATIRIGDADQTKTFVAGIRGVTPDQPDGLSVIIDSDGQLGTTTSAFASLSGMNTFSGTNNQFTQGLSLTGGNLNLHADGIIHIDGVRLLHATGSSNFFAGPEAGNLTMTGPFNTAIGTQALYSNTIGDFNTASGYKALRSNTTGRGNTATGVSSLIDNTTGGSNTATGWQALFSNTTGSLNTASGAAALRSNTTGSFNTASGFEALRENTNAGRNVAIGSAALKTQSYDPGFTWNSQNVAVGYGALEFNQPTATFDGYNNTALGNEALNKNTTGSWNTASGSAALWSNTTGEENTANGRVSLYSNTTGSWNTASGSSALLSNTTGAHNTANGRFALQMNTDASGNTATGAWSLRENLTGGANSAFGSNALRNNTAGERNAAFGVSALNNNTGSSNIALGSFAGANLTTGDNNIMIGNNGFAAEEKTIRIGDSDQTRAIIAGDVTAAGAVIPGSNLGTATAGMIRWTGSDFEGYNGTDWVSLTMVSELKPFMEFVTVGNKGNAADSTSYGDVAYQYQIGKYEVTNAQYSALLNAVAATDTNSLYNETMGSNARGGITQSGSSGSFTYVAKANMGDKPVNYVTFWDACRFCNWLHNGRPSGAQDSTTTEDGAYDLTVLDAITNNTVARETGARFFIPTEDEWYKAAYHQPSALGGDTDNYWSYPTQSNSVPTVATADTTGDISNGWLAGNIANYNSGADWNGENGNVTTVGTGGPGSASFYGAFDMGGNVYEMNDTISGSSRGNRGGSLNSVVTLLQASLRGDVPTTFVRESFGFRLASP